MRGKRTKYNNETLEEISMKLEKIQEIIGDAMSGMSMIESTGTHNVGVRQFRRILDTVHCMQIHNGASQKSDLTGLSKDFLCTPIEALYGDIYSIHGDDWEKFSIPENAEESYRYVSADLTQMEKDIIELYYFDNLSLREIGGKFGVTCERIRQIKKDAVRKLRHPSRIKILSAGIDEWDRRQEKLETEDIEKMLNAEAHVVTNSLLNEAIDVLGLSTRSYKCLRRASVNSIKDILMKNFNNLTHIRNLGEKSICEIISKTYEFFKIHNVPEDNVFAARRDLLGITYDEPYVWFVTTIIRGEDPFFKETGGNIKTKYVLVTVTNILKVEIRTEIFKTREDAFGAMKDALYERLKIDGDEKHMPLLEDGIGLSNAKLKDDSAVIYQDFGDTYHKWKIIEV